LLDDGLLAYSRPEKPTNWLQKYSITAKRLERWVEA
jgi:hypothetical protein